MDAKEALRYFNFVVTIGRAYYPNSEAFKAYELAVSALEKVETLEAENARLRENADKWTDLISKAGAVGLNETDFFKMVESDKK